MNAYRKLYNQMLELKFNMLDIFDSEGREAMSDEFDLINKQLQELDELATEEYYATQTHTEFITGSK